MLIPKQKSKSSRKLFSCISEHGSFLLCNIMRLGSEGKLVLVGRTVTGLMYPTRQAAGWESKRGKLSPFTPLSSSVFVPLLLPCHLLSIYTRLEKIKTRPCAWLPCECAVLHVYYGSTGGQTQPTLFMCPRHQRWTKSSRWQRCSQKTRVMWRAARLQADLFFIVTRRCRRSCLFGSARDTESQCVRWGDADFSYQNFAGWYLRKSLNMIIWPKCFHNSTHISLNSFNVINIFSMLEYVTLPVYWARHWNHESRRVSELFYSHFPCDSDKFVSSEILRS